MMCANRALIQNKLFYQELICLKINCFIIFRVSRMPEKQLVTLAWCRLPATWSLSEGYKCGRGEHFGATWRRYTQCTGVLIPGILSSLASLLRCFNWVNYFRYYKYSYSCYSNSSSFILHFFNDNNFGLSVDMSY